MNNDTKSVNVLAVLDSQIATAELFGNTHDVRGEMPGLVTMREARAAVSALIGVAQSGKREGDAQERRQWLVELDAALARVQGGVK